MTEFPLITSFNVALKPAEQTFGIDDVKVDGKDIYLLPFAW